jgi:hypothetical protein
MKVREIARRIFLEDDPKLVAAFEKPGTCVLTIISSVFAADYPYKDKCVLIWRFSRVEERPLGAVSALPISASLRACLRPRPWS